MSSLVPVLYQKDLESITMIRAGSSFALKAFHAPRNMEVSLKLLTSQKATERDVKALLQEVATIRCLQNARLMPPLGVCQFQGVFGVVTEWMSNGSLSLLIHEHELYPELPFPLCVRILTDVAEALSYLHHLERPVLHHSLKPSNILLDRQYRAKISDYGLATWRKKQLSSALQNCSTRSCWDLLYLSPEILQGGSFSKEGNIYSFGMVCWEILSRQKLLKGKKTLLEAVTGVCSGVRPGIEPEFIPNSLPNRNKLLHLIILCWHQETSYRPRAEECQKTLQDILGTFKKEVISDAIYSLIHAKDCAIDGAKGPAAHVLEMDTHNLEVICPQNNNRLDKIISFKAQSLSSIHLAGKAGKVAHQTTLASHTPHNTALERDHPVSSSNGSSPLNSFPTFLLPDPSTGGEGIIPYPRGSEDWQKGPPQLVRGPDHTLTGPCCKESSCSILSYGREAILSGMTEGRLNQILDVLRSQRLLSRMDYETITAFPTLTGRARALLDTCLRLGEKAAQTVVTVLSASKCSPLTRSILANAVH
ncbi:receptor-interacting serine/threonine-protein kinase 2-like [Hemicordylus capensis]|uniref:receptor-interacting serine/threonine-protein kinase 2-like n=1 Tax=Hemicordylus capensis TaxID=884348 RepID=UPI0023049E8D|nr:receptor-interacting serine/threonine-protein kinase 2-like [Hemicordylus capensis]